MLGEVGPLPHNIFLPRTAQTEGHMVKTKRVPITKRISLKGMKLVFTIEYTVDGFEEGNIEEMMETLNGNGSARIIKTEGEITQ